MDMSNAFQTVNSFNGLAKDSSNRGALLQDVTCPQFLAYALGENDVNLLKLSLETLELLADTHRHKLKLGSIFGIFEALQATAEKEELGDEINSTALSLLTDLKFARNNKPSRIAATFSGPLNKEPQSPGVDSRNLYNNSTRKSKIVTLHIKGMKTLDDRNRIEDELIRIRGVISIVCDIPTCRATLRVRDHIKPEHLFAKIQADEPELVVKTEDGGETLKSLANAEVHTDTVDALPDYLPEDDPPVDNNAVTKHPVSDAGYSWISSAASFVKRSFYW